MKEPSPASSLRWGRIPNGRVIHRTSFRRGAAQERRYPGTRLGVEDEIREDFIQAKIYQAQWRIYNDRVARGEHPIPPKRDLRLEPLVEVLEGKRYVHAHSYRADEILALIRTADELGFKIRTFQHVLEGYKVADEIAAPRRRRIHLQRLVRIQVRGD